MAKFHTGKKGKISVGGTDLNITGWSATVETDAVEVTHTGGSGYREYISGLTGGTGSFDAVWDTDAALTDQAPHIARGNEYAIVLYIGNPDDAFDTISANVLITSIDITSSRDDAVTYSASFQFTKTITFS